MDRENSKILIVLLLCLLASCHKDKPEALNNTSSATAHTFVVCEGNFGNGNASLYSINNSLDSTFGDLYTTANNQALGDVFQSMTRIGNYYFLCINNSDKVIVTDAATLRNVKTISVPKPRYMLQVSTDKAYVSSLYNNKVYIIDIPSLAITDSINFPYTNTEGMCMVNGSAFISIWDTACNKIFAIDPASRSIHPITINGYAPQAILTDKEQMIWVMAGNKTKGRQASLSRIDPSTGSILATYNFPAAADPLKPVWNRTKDTIYYIEIDYTGSSANNGVYRMGIHQTQLPEQAFITAATNQYYWGLGIDPATNYIYIGDPKGFIQKGSVLIYKPDGSRLAQLNVGLGPGSFYFGN